MNVKKELKDSMIKFLENVLDDVSDCHEFTLNKRILPCEIVEFLESIDLECEYSGENGWQHDCWYRVIYKDEKIMTLSTDRYYGVREFDYDPYSHSIIYYRELLGKLMEINND